MMKTPTPTRGGHGLLLCVVTAIMLATGVDAHAQGDTPGLRDAVRDQGPAEPPGARTGDDSLTERVPSRRVGRALAQTLLVNGAYGVANLARGQVTARITPASWRANLVQGWVWDLDDFTVNQVGHPYQGSQYFNAGRANGLSFWESAALTALGSSTWEYLGETNAPSLNDLVNTTMGGVALGEVLHRVGWLIRGADAPRGRTRWREIAAAAVDPITGANRLLDGQASRSRGAPTDGVPIEMTGAAAGGLLWRGTRSGAFTATGQPFLEGESTYGRLAPARSRTPYDTFSARFRLGGGSAISEARVRGRLLGQPLRQGALQFTVLQTYDYQKNDAYQTGAQSIEAAVGGTSVLTSRVRLHLAGWGGFAVLGAIDSRPLGRQPDFDWGGGGQGEPDGPRNYDYGPGATFGASLTATRDAAPLGTLLYEGRQVYSLDGVRANHILQRVRLDLEVPLRGPIGLGAAFEYFSRKTYFQDELRTIRHYRYPQVRTYLSWRPRLPLAEQPERARAPRGAAALTEGSTSGASPLWLTIGGTWSTVRRDCQTCARDYRHRRGTGVLVNLGYRVNSRLDAGAELFRTGVGNRQGELRTTHLDAVTQFRPWSSRGLFIKGGAGMAFVGQLLDELQATPRTSKALSVVLGAGWVFRPAARVGLQLSASHHAAALGDLRTATGDRPDVMANFWSLGASVVVR